MYLFSLVRIWLMYGIEAEVLLVGGQMTSHKQNKRIMHNTENTQTQCSLIGERSGKAKRG